MISDNWNWNKKELSPIDMGWYITGSKNTHYPETAPRFYDASDGSWWIYSNHGDNYTLVPNNAFDYWCRMPRVDELYEKEHRQMTHVSNLRVEAQSYLREVRELIDELAALASEGEDGEIQWDSKGEWGV